MCLPENFYDSYLLKFGKEEHLSLLQKGNIFMNILRYYVELEEKAGQVGIGDKREASLLNIVKHELFIETDKGEVRKIPIGPPPGIIYDREALNHPIFCAMKKEVKMTRVNDEEYIGNLNLTKSDIKDFVDNNYTKVLLIYSPDTFLKRFLYKLVQENICYRFGAINYKNMSIPKIRNGCLELGNTFTKDIRFKNQHEYRIELIQKHDKAFTLDIGDISDISCITDFESLVKGIHLRKRVKLENNM